MKISIIIPVFHEEKNIEKVLREISKKIKTEHEVLVVYDTPKDPTVPVVKKFSRKSKQQTRLIKNIFGSGKGVMNAIKTGFASAKGDAIVVVMADLSDDISQIDSMFTYIQKGYSVVCASRFMKGGKKIGGTFLKNFLSKTADISLRFLIGLPTHDATNAYKMYSSDFLKIISVESSGGFEYSLEITLKAFFSGKKIIEIPTVWRDREAGTSNFHLWKWLPQYLKWYTWGIKEKFLLPTIYIFYVVLALFITLSKVGTEIINKITISAPLDLSWQTDAVERLLHGFIAGKDYIFTYGPVFQVLYSLPSLLWHVPSYVSVALAPLFFSIFVSAIVLYISYAISETKIDKLILPGMLLFIVQIVPLLAENNGIRFLFPLLYATMWISSIAHKKNSLKKLLLLALLPSIGGLYVYDLFPQTILIGAIGICYVTFMSKESMRRKSIMAMIFVFGVIVFQLLASFLISGNLSYMKDSLTTLSDYYYIMNVAWEKGRSNYLLIFPFLIILMQIVLLKTRSVSRYFKTAGFVLLVTALLQLRTAVIRSDSGHIESAFLPSIFVSFIFLYYLFKQYKLATSIVFILLFLLIPFRSTFYSYLSAKNFSAVLREIKQGKNTSFESLYIFSKNYTISSEERAQLFRFISSHKNIIMVYPYDTVLLNALQTTFNTYALQLYDYSQSSIEQKTVDLLKKNPPQYILLQVDGKSTFALDGIPNFTRNPFVANWMITNYSVFKQIGSVLLLTYTPGKEAISKPQEQNCQIISLVGDFADTSLLHIIKPSLYYFIYQGAVRLPIKPNITTYTIFSKTNSVESSAELFNTGISFSHPRENTFLEKNAKIVSVNFLNQVTFYPDTKIFCLQ